jgi:prephenate dehydratase
MKVAFQGEKGAYSEEAILKHWGSEAEPVPKPNLKDVFEAVENKKIRLGLVPVENSIQGSIVRTYDLLNTCKIMIIGETILRINHCLIANPGVKKSEIRKVYSHPQALAQSSKYIERHNFDPITTYDTAGSVKIIKENGTLNTAAIASARAAKVYNMNILERGIENNKKNYTRFFIIGHDELEYTGNDKTTLVFSVEKGKNTVLDAFNILSKKGVNITKIQARPFVGKPWEYLFFLDVIGHKSEKPIYNALKELESVTFKIRVLGSYPITQI